MRIPRRGPEKARLEVIPMIDIVFFLLVFFMISTLSMTINRGLPVSLPKAVSSQADLRETFNITVTQAGEIFLNKAPMTLQDLAQEVKAGLAKDAELLVIITADDQALHGAIVDVNVLGPPTTTPPDTPYQAAEGAAAGAGKLFERGDASVVPGDAAGGGAGGAGRVGYGTGGPGSSTPVAGLQPGVGGEGAGGGTGPLARPLGGYQVKPRYPESARRQGIEGTIVLKIYVSDKGRVEDILVERSAGHQDLDLAAVEAVKKWRFEPARRGKQAVAVWVMLPVRFELR